MLHQPIRLFDGQASERPISIRSRRVSLVFLVWLSLPAACRSIDDAGCGNGPFSRAAAQRCAPAEMQRTDPPDEQLRFMRNWMNTKVASFVAAYVRNTRFDVSRMSALHKPLITVGLAGDWRPSDRETKDFRLQGLLAFSCQQRVCRCRECPRMTG